MSYLFTFFGGNFFAIACFFLLIGRLGDAFSFFCFMVAVLAYARNLHVTTAKGAQP